MTELTKHDDAVQIAEMIQHLPTKTRERLLYITQGAALVVEAEASQSDSA